MKKFQLSPACFLLFAALLTEGGLAVLAVCLGRSFGIPVVSRTKWEESAIWIQAILVGSAAVLPPLVLCWGIYRFSWKSVELIKKFLDIFYNDFLRHCRIWQILFLSILAGLGEELFFRGLLQTGLIKWLAWFGASPTAASVSGILLASLFFGLAHPVSRLYVMICFLIGIYCGLLFLVTGNILVPIFFHAEYDFLVIVLWPKFSSRVSSR
ncbi:MAG: CPBP family intramembrane metalloprotease [Planctomycetaceae bacterium]|nr:CPBP family intramembrane metalloprotease [Planctomycetaceae bacterium]